MWIYVAGIGIGLALMAAAVVLDVREVRRQEAAVRLINKLLEELEQKLAGLRADLSRLELRVNVMDEVLTQHSAELDELQRTKHVEEPANLTEDPRPWMGDAVTVPSVTEDEENGDQEKGAPEWMVDAGAAGASGADPETIHGYFNTGE